jgi:hypothetical protein
VSDCLANQGARSDCLECEWGRGAGCFVGSVKEWKRTLYCVAGGCQRRKVKNGMLVLMLELARERRERERRGEERGKRISYGGAMA